MSDEARRREGSYAVTFAQGAIAKENEINVVIDSTNILSNLHLIALPQCMPERGHIRGFIALIGSLVSLFVLYVLPLLCDLMPLAGASMDL
jgi:hypothetical protein